MKMPLAFFVAEQPVTWSHVSNNCTVLNEPNCSHPSLKRHKVRPWWAGRRRGMVGEFGGQNVTQKEDAPVLITGHSSGGEKNLGYIRPSGILQTL